MRRMLRGINRNNHAGKALILGNDNCSFLATIRSLGRKHICIHVGWCDAHLSALKSKYISAYHYIPPFSLTDDNWKNSLIKLLQNEHYDIVIPCNDQAIIPLQLHKQEFDNIARMCLLDDACYKLANDKFAMHKLAEQLGINVPKGIEISKHTQIEYILSELSFPVVLKPRSSFAPEKLYERQSVHKAHTIDELKSYLEKLEDNEVLAAQKDFIGKGAGIELLAYDGAIIYSFQHIRIHEPLTGGGSSYRKSVRPHSELLEASARIIKALNYTGVAMVEVKINPATNDWVFIELNARLWGSLPLAVAAGADFPYYLYLM